VLLDTIVKLTSAEGEQLPAERILTGVLLHQSVKAADAGRLLTFTPTGRCDQSWTNATGPIATGG
jgi:hypothetical protein